MNTVSWVLLIIAGLLEIVWASTMKSTEGFTKLWPSVFTVLGMIASFLLLATAMKTIPAGTAYAVWTGIGALGVVLVGIFWLGEPLTLWRSFFLAMILGGVVGLKMTG